MAIHKISYTRFTKKSQQNFLGLTITWCNRIPCLSDPTDRYRTTFVLLTPMTNGLEHDVSLIVSDTGAHALRSGCTYR